MTFGKNVNERPNVGGISNRSRNGAPSRKGCVVNGQMTINKASNKRLPPPPPSIAGIVTIAERRVYE